MSIDRNCLSYWFPLLRDAGLPVPETRIVRSAHDLSPLLDGTDPEGFFEFIAELRSAALAIGLPCFLRTGQGSNKWAWGDSCYLTDIDLLPHHVANLVEWSEMADIMGLSHDVWAVRRIIPTVPLFHAFRGRMPITREFRFFVRDGQIEHAQPYWPAGAIEDEDPSDPNWRKLLTDAQYMENGSELLTLAMRAGEALGGFWSIDLLQDANGKWWITDAADGERSFRYDPNAPEKKKAKYIGAFLVPEDD